MMIFYKNYKMHVVCMTVALFARPHLTSKTQWLYKFRTEIYETRAINTVKCKPAKRIKILS